jgi:LPS sulfotransferase NodH
MPLGVDPVSMPIFVVGCGRSGTTLLRLMLNRHPQIACFGESAAFFRYGKYGRLDNQSELHRFIQDWQVACERESPHPDMMATGGMRERLRTSGSYVEATSVVMNEFARLENKRLWGEKTPAHVHRIPAIRAAFPKARIIHITRDPRPVVSSSILTLGDGRMSPRNVYNSAKYWVRCEEAIERAHGVMPAQIHRVRYEELVREPEAVLRAICDFLGVPFAPGMLQTGESAIAYAPRASGGGGVAAHHTGLLEDVNTRTLERWRDELHPAVVGVIEHAAGKWMRRRGYAFAPHDRSQRPSAPQRLLLEAHWLIFELRRKVYVTLQGLAWRLGPTADV